MHIYIYRYYSDSDHVHIVALVCTRIHLNHWVYTCECTPTPSQTYRSIYTLTPLLIYTHKHTYEYICACMHTLHTLFVNEFMHNHSCMHTYTHASTCAYVLMYLHAHTYNVTHVYACAHSCTCLHSCSHAWMSMQTCRYIYAYASFI